MAKSLKEFVNLGSISKLTQQYAYEAFNIGVILVGECFSMYIYIKSKSRLRQHTIPDMSLLRF